MSGHREGINYEDRHEILMYLKTHTEPVSLHGLIDDFTQPKMTQMRVSSAVLSMLEEGVLTLDVERVLRRGPTK